MMVPLIRWLVGIDPRDDHASLAPLALAKPERNAARPGFSGRHDDLGATYRKRQSAHGRAFDEATPANVRHRHLLPE
jgi:hypothetical protein